MAQLSAGIKLPAPCFISKRYSMGFFECCHKCKAPKRHTGCHKSCPEYAKAKKEFEEHKETVRLHRYVEQQGLYKRKK